MIIQGQRRARPWFWLSIVAALVAMAGNLVGLLVPTIYSELTPAFLPQAYAQDLANLVLVSPALILLAALSFRGSVRAYLLWLGVLTFTVYNYMIYTFSIPFGPLFLLWVAVLGMSIYALIGGITTVDPGKIKACFSGRVQIRVVAGALIGAAGIFSFVWLSEDIPALLAGTAPASVTEMGLPTNPVHVLDLSFFLPATFLTGVLLFKRSPLGYALAPALLVFLILTGVPILLTPGVQQAIGQKPNWDVALPIGTLTLVLLGLLLWLLASISGEIETHLSVRG